MGYLTDFYDGIVAQLEFHTDRTQSTAILPDVYFYKSPIEENRGNKDYPQVRIWLPSVEEAGHGPEYSNATFSIGLMLAVRNYQNSQTAIRELLDLYERVGDALFIRTDGTTLTTNCLGNVNAGRVRLSMTEMEANETSINAISYISANIPAAKGNRRHVV